MSNERLPALLRLLPPGLIILAGLLVYSNSFHGEFILDDHSSITENESIRQLRPIWQVLMPVDIPTTVTARPVINLSLAVNYAIGGTNVTGYHVMNLVIHLLAALTLYGIVRRTLELNGIPPLLHNASRMIALIVGLIWCVHPLQTAAVSYIVQRAESIMSLFYLLTLYTFIRAASSSNSSTAWYLLSVICCWLGMASKEVMVSAPLMLLLYDRIYLSADFRSVLKRRWPYYAALSSSWVLLGLLVYTGRSLRMAGFGLGVGSMDYALTQFGVITRYLMLSFYPVTLIFDYGVDIAEHTMEIVPYALFIMTLLIISVYLLFRRPRTGLICIWFFVLLAPTSSILPMASQTAAEQRMYLPLAAVVIITVVSYAYLLHRIPAKGRRYMNPVTLIAVLTILSLLGLRTYARNSDYRHAVDMWKLTIRQQPENSRAYSNLGVQLNRRRRFDEALGYLDTAISLNPDLHTAVHNRGVALEGLGRFEEAVTQFNRSEALGLTHPSVYLHRGCSQLELGRYKQAVTDLTRVIDYLPEHAVAFYKRGLAWKHLGEFDKAFDDFSVTVELAPRHADAWLERGLILAKRKAYQPSIDDFSRAIEVSPEYGLAYKNRAISYYATGEYERAWQDVEKAKQLGEDFPDQFIKLLEHASKAGSSH